MAYYTLETQGIPTIVIERVDGNLEVKGWEREEISVKTSGGEEPIKETKPEGVRIASDGNCSVHVPRSCNLQIETVGGNANLKYIDGGLKINVVHGKLGLRECSESSIDMVHGELWAKNLSGDLQIDNVHGNTYLRNIDGSCTTRQIAGNLNLRDVEGDVNAIAGGNAQLRFSHLGGESYQIIAGGNVKCKVPPGASLSIELTSGTGQIQVRTPEARNTYNSHNHNMTLADGYASMKLTAGGNISFEGDEIDLADLEDLEDEFADAFADISSVYSDEIASQIEEQIEAQMEIINTQMENLSETISRAGLSDEQVERVMKRARDAGEQASERAQARMRRAQEKMERKLAAAKRRAELKAQAVERRSKIKGGAGPQSWKVSTGDVSQANPVTDEERLMILRMLEQKKISPQEAEKLLAALEGK